MALSDTACAPQSPVPKFGSSPIADGLQLWVMPNGSRLWRLAYRFGGKQKLLAFGRYPIFSLAEVRKSRDEARKQIAPRLLIHR